MARPRPAPDFEPQRALAATLPGATEDIKWGADLVYSVGGKMFCVFLLEAGRAATCSFRSVTFRAAADGTANAVVTAPVIHTRAGRPARPRARSPGAGVAPGEPATPHRPAAKPGPHGERTVKA